jgi:hypothetical protein
LVPNDFPWLQDNNHGYDFINQEENLLGFTRKGNSKNAKTGFLNYKNLSYVVRAKKDQKGLLPEFFDLKFDPASSGRLDMLNSNFLDFYTSSTFFGNA